MKKYKDIAAFWAAFQTIPQQKHRFIGEIINNSLFSVLKKSLYTCTYTKQHKATYCIRSLSAYVISLVILC